MNNLSNESNFPPKLSVVIPVYNEENIVEELVERCRRACMSTGYSFEIIIVNDGSYDKTIEILLLLKKNIPEMKIINLRRNFGHMPALFAGLSIAKGQGIVVMDGDLQDPPELIPNFVKKWEEGAEVVYGKRVSTKDGLLKKFFSLLFYLIINHVASFEIPKHSGTYSIMDRSSLDALLSLDEKHRYFPGLRAWIGGKQDILQYKRESRKFGWSRVGFIGQVRLAVLAICTLSTLPLRYAAVLCTLYVLLAPAVGITVFYNLLYSYIYLICAVPIFGGSFSIALIYLAFLFDEGKKRPLYFISSII